MRERRPGVWELIVQLPREPTRARARQVSRSVHGTKREAQRALAALVAEVSTGKVTAASGTLGELLARWLDLVGDHLSPTTVREYRRLVDTMLEPDLGKLSLRRVTTQRLDAYYGSLLRERHLSPASIRHVHAVLRGALGQAVARRSRQRSPHCGARHGSTTGSVHRSQRMSRRCNCLRSLRVANNERGRLLGEERRRTRAGRRGSGRRATRRATRRVPPGAGSVISSATASRRSLL